MRLGIASWSFILITLIFLVVKDGSARKIALRTETDNQLMKPLHYDLKHNNIMQVNKNSHEIEAGEEEDDDDDNHRRHQEQADEDFYSDEQDDDDNDDDKEDDDKKKGKKESKKEHKDEHKKLIMDDPDEQNVFFTTKDLYVGKTMRAYFAKKNSSTSPKFLPREEAQQIPFSKKNLSSILKLFSIPKHSPQAKAIKHTLKNCQFEGETNTNTNTNTKFCATSLESLLDSASQVFGSDPQLKVLTTTHITNSTTVLQNYTITEVEEIISVPNLLGCHPMPYPYAVFYCQTQKNDTKLYEVLVEGENGARVQVAAVCHVDTSKWYSDHVSFRVLNIEPGTSPVCHFFHSDNLVLVLSPAPTPSP